MSILRNLAFPHNDVEPHKPPHTVLICIPWLHIGSHKTLSGRPFKFTVSS